MELHCFALASSFPRFLKGERKEKAAQNPAELGSNCGYAMMSPQLLPGRGGQLGGVSLDCQKTLDRHCPEGSS